ncbi:MAG TPA: hypothetical protein PLE74_07755 [Candidatus Cloacimonadota bacterium]|nr:hypothetical protein [Candidatus Cloacimonadota bacterium]HPT72160.1 hypothetical protein [Candidatus Cloacimonadota bacterium]
MERIIFFLMIFFTVKMEDINFVSRETYRGSSRGFEIGLVDICTMIIFLLVWNRRFKFKLSMPPGAPIYFIYLFFSIISVFNSAVVLYSAFEVWKMVRMFIFFWVVYNYFRDLNQLYDLMGGIAAITIYVTYEVLQQKYIMHIFQTSGPFPHQNSLVMYMIIFCSLIFSYLLNKHKMSPRNFAMWIVIFGMGAGCIVSSLSRAGMILFGLSCIIILAISLGSGLSYKKVGVTVLLLFMSGLLLFKAWGPITERFKTAPEQSATTRVDLAIAAVKMANDKTFGIGLNNFGVKVNPPYSYSSHIEMYNPESEEEKNGLVETTYLMIAAETGWHNLLVFFIFIFYYLFMNIRNYFLYRGSDFQFVPIAFIGGLLAIYLESSLEWVLKQTNNFYQLMLIFAIIAGMHRIAIEKRKMYAARLGQVRK